MYTSTEDAVVRLIECSQSTAPAAKRVEAAASLTEELFERGDIEGVKSIIEHVFGPNSSGMLLCRPIVRAVVSRGESSSHFLTLNQLESLWKLLLNHLLKHAGVYEEEETTVRQHLSNLLHSTGRLSEAGRCLAEMHWSTQEGTPLKLKLLVTAIELFLSAADVKEAEGLLPRAVVIATDCENQVELQFRLQLVQARIADLTHQYLEAARRYLDLARTKTDNSQVAEYLGSAATCAILSPAGPKRNKILATLLKQAPELKERDIVEKILSGRLIRPQDLQELEKTLQAHHRAPDVEGTTAIEKAFRDHNVSAASLTFKTISFQTLARLLRATPEIAERTAAQMVRQGRLSNVVIDGNKGFVRFAQRESIELEDGNSRLAEIFRRIDTVFEIS